MRINYFSRNNEERYNFNQSYMRKIPKEKCLLHLI